MARKPKEKTRLFKTTRTKTGEEIQKPELTLTEDDMADAPVYDHTEEAKDITDDAIITTGDLTREDRS